MKTFLIIVAVIIITLLVYVGFYAGFYSPKITINNEGGEYFVYENMKGAYSKSGEIMDKVYFTLLNDFQIKSEKGCGIYYDNPKEISEKDLRSDVGCLIENPDSSKLASISQKYKIIKLEETEYIVTDFPFKGKMSILFGIMKVYPKFDAYCKKNGYSVQNPYIEIYDGPKKLIHYRRKSH